MVLWCLTDGDSRARAHTLVVRGAAEFLEVPASDLRVGHEAGGRPVVRGAGRGLEVSVSHAHGVAAVALARRRPVGVDVEVVRRLNAGALARRWLDSTEADWLEGLAGADRSTAFLCLWTQKESAGKALGRGLRGGGMSRRVPLPDRWPPDPEAPLVPVPLPGEPTIASAAILVGNSDLVLGLAVGRRRGEPDVPVRVRRVVGDLSG